MRSFSIVDGYNNSQSHAAFLLQVEVSRYKCDGIGVSLLFFLSILFLILRDGIILGFLKPFGILALTLHFQY